MAEALLSVIARHRKPEEYGITQRIGHSLSKELVDLYQRVIADPTNSGVSLSTAFGDSDTKLIREKRLSLSFAAAGHFG
jgi:hypothetical protein